MERGMSDQKSTDKDLSNSQENTPKKLSEADQLLMRMLHGRRGTPPIVIEPTADGLSYEDSDSPEDSE
jgi:hypothetical protein